MRSTVDSVKVIVQNNSTGLYLCPKGYWNVEQRYVTYPDIRSLEREIKNLNATYKVIRETRPTVGISI